MYGQLTEIIAFRVSKRLRAEIEAFGGDAVSETVRYLVQRGLEAEREGRPFTPLNREEMGDVVATVTRLLQRGLEAEQERPGGGE